MWCVLQIVCADNQFFMYLLYMEHLRTPCLNELMCITLSVLFVAQVFA